MTDAKPGAKPCSYDHSGYVCMKCGWVRRREETMTTQELHLAAAKAMGWMQIHEEDGINYGSAPTWIRDHPSLIRTDSKWHRVLFTIRDVGPIIERYGIWIARMEAEGTWRVSLDDDEDDFWNEQTDLLTAVLTLVVERAEAGKLKEVKE